MLNKKLRILIRTSGGKAPTKELGLGHIFRCLNLAEFLKNNKLYFFVEDFGGVKQIFYDKKIKQFTIIQKNISIENDIKQTVKFIINNKIDIVIVDRYNVRIKYLQALKKFSKVVYISDLNKIDFPAHLIINGFVGFSNSVVKNSYGVKCLLGPKYIILNKKFSKKPKIKKYDLLITFGGFDENNIAILAIKELLKQNYNFKTKIIFGPSSTHNIMKHKKISSKNSITILSYAKNMYEHISSSKFGLCSGGITSYEFAAMNIPFAIICQVKHQLISAKIWEKNGKAINLGFIDKTTESKIGEILKKLSENRLKSFSNKKIVDGLGGIKVAKEIERLGNI